MKKILLNKLIKISYRNSNARMHVPVFGPKVLKLVALFAMVYIMNYAAASKHLKVDIFNEQTVLLS